MRSGLIQFETMRGDEQNVVQGVAPLSMVDRPFLDHPLIKYDRIFEISRFTSPDRMILGGELCSILICRTFLNIHALKLP